MSTGNPVVLKLLAEQRRRCLATILNSAESSPWWRTLSDEDKDTFRGQVRAALTVFYDLTRDVVRVTEDDKPEGIRNDIALELIKSIHSSQQRIVEHLEA